MSESYESLSQLSGEELYSLVNALKREINCLSTDLLKFELISEKCRKYLTNLLNVGEIDRQLTQQLLHFIESNDTDSRVKCGSRNESIIGGRIDCLINEYIHGYHFKTTSNDNWIDIKTTDRQTSDNCDKNVTKRLKTWHKIDGKYVCDYNNCDKSYSSPEALKEHQMSHTGRRFFCDFDNCCKHFSFSSSLRKHQKSGQHVFGQPFRCCVTDCPFETLAKEEFVAHIVSHSGDGVPQESAECYERTHELTVKVDKPYACHWVGCRMTFKRADTLRAHRRCHIRGKGYTSEDKLVSDEVNDKYVCDFKDCGKSYVYKRGLRQHKNSCHLSQRLFCDHDNCYQHFATPTALREHRESGDHVPGDGYRCAVNDCEFQTESKVKLEKHMKSSHDLTGKPVDKLYTCDWVGCGKGFRKADNLRAHMRCHTRGMGSMSEDIYNNEGKYVCDIKDCGKSYSYRKGLREHQLAKHSGRRYFCDYDTCCRHFRHSSSLTMHKRSGEHVLGQPYQCTAGNCPFQTADKLALEGHMSGHTGDDYRFRQRQQKWAVRPRQYRCPAQGCDQRFVDRCDYYRHKRTHQTERVFACDVEGCGKSFRRHKDLTTHRVARHTDALTNMPWIACQWPGCPYRHKWQCFIDTHMRVHTKPFICDECGKGFAKKMALKVHKTTHNKELSLRCEWPGCERVFCSGYTLRAHMNRHTGDKVYRCHWPGCDKQYLDRKVLSAHEMKHRPQEYQYRCHWPGCEFKTKYNYCLKSHVKKHA